MLKWSEYRQDDVLFEAYLPGHESEQQQWLLRASRDGIVLKERVIRLTHVPRFGPDADDVVKVEAALDEMLRALTSGKLDESPLGSRTSYEPPHPHLVENTPLNAALAHMALEAYASLVESLHLDPTTSRRFAGLPPELPIAGTLPLQVTVAMRNTMEVAVGTFLQVCRIKDPVRKAAYIARLEAELTATSESGIRALSDELVRAANA